MNVKLTPDPRTMPDGTVLTLGVRYASSEGQRPNPTVYTYAALKSAGVWYLTGGTGRVPTAAGWGAVERWLGKDGRELVSVEIMRPSLEVVLTPVDTSQS